MDYTEDDNLRVTARVCVPIRELRFSFARSSGPGGQNVNKVNTKATLHWAIDANETLPDDVRERFLARYRRRINAEGQLVVTSQRFRSQERNRSDCIEKLGEMLRAVATRPRPRKATKPSRAAIERRLQNKKQKSQKKQQRRPPKLDS